MSRQAGATLTAAVMAALRELGGLTGVHEAMSLQAAAPHASVEAGLEADWGHKSGLGREVRLTVTLRDQGERPTRLRASRPRSRRHSTGSGRSWTAGGS